MDIITGIVIVFGIGMLAFILTKGVKISIDIKHKYPAEEKQEPETMFVQDGDGKVKEVPIAEAMAHVQQYSQANPVAEALAALNDYFGDDEEVKPHGSE